MVSFAVFPRAYMQLKTVREESRGCCETVNASYGAETWRLAKKPKKKSNTERAVERKMIGETLRSRGSEIGQITDGGCRYSIVDIQRKKWT